MKKILLMSAAVSMVAFSANALDLSPYVSAKAMLVDFDSELSAGGQSIDIDDSNVFGGAIALGIKNTFCTGSAIRAEIEYTKTGEGEVKSIEGVKFKPSAEAYMFNMYYDFNLDSKFTPYIGAGIGTAKTKYKLKEDGYSESFSDRQFAWQAGVGIAYAATDHVSVDFGYRYADYGDFSKKFANNHKVKFDTKANEIYLGLR